MGGARAFSSYAFGFSIDKPMTCFVGDAARACIRSIHLFIACMECTVSLKTRLLIPAGAFLIFPKKKESEQEE